MPPKGSKLGSAEKKQRADARDAALAKGYEYLETLIKEHEEEVEDLQEALRNAKMELARRPDAAATVSTATHNGKVDMPVFWEDDVDMWFQQVEAGFSATERPPGAVVRLYHDGVAARRRHRQPLSHPRLRFW